ncbi:hypothetical protein ACH5RR_005089 [Cinchona calisaya]|uniref:Uncharacterized protein n=1 Tax=Cinchona calisaya TaxID=153742 RepID=A0ABD3B027_9GENT
MLTQKLYKISRLLLSMLSQQTNEALNRQLQKTVLLLMRSNILLSYSITCKNSKNTFNFKFCRKKPILLTMWKEYEDIDGIKIAEAIATAPLIIATRVKVTTFTVGHLQPDFLHAYSTILQC